MPEPRARSDDPLRVLVVDADDRVRESLSGLLVIGGRCTVVASAGQAGAAFDLALDYDPDVVVVDPRLPEVDTGLAFISRIRSSLPDVRILAMSSSDSVEPAVLASGADRFVRKTFRPTELVAAVQNASRRPDTSESGAA